MLRGVSMVVSGGSQDFLGYRSTAFLLGRCPAAFKKALALNLLDISPHYFYRSPENRRLRRSAYLESEFQRNRVSREQIIQSLVRGQLAGLDTVLDYGCGPGFLAIAAAPYAAKVYGCDLSRGVVACAQAVNPAPNVTYCALEKGRIPLAGGSVDLVYSFAVIQHVTDTILNGILAEWKRVLRPGGRVLCHVVLNGAGWKTEAEWRADRSWRGRLKWQFGMHCFSRTREAFGGMVTRAGFSMPDIQQISDLAPALKDDIFHQQLCIFRKVDLC